MEREPAQTLALTAAAWLASDGDMLAHFMNATGMGASELRASLADPNTLAALMDFIFMEDAWVLD